MAALKQSFPWVQTPLIVNAPMAGFAGAELATQVTLAGGFGMTAIVNDMAQLRLQLSSAATTFAKARAADHNIDSYMESTGLLPLGVGMLPFILDIEQVLPVLADFKPAVVWLFAAKELVDYAVWATRIRKLSPRTQIWIQTGSVAAAMKIYREVHPSVICLQGADAGGHGYEKGAGIITLMPETQDAFMREGFNDVHFFASGGIVDGRGVAAALALGAAGVVMGTRFLASREVTIHPTYQSAILEASDGGQVTTRSKLFDNLRGPNIWPDQYDGRSIVMRSFVDYKAGTDIEEIRRLYQSAVSEDDKGYGIGGRGRAAIWAGTGVGLVRQVESAKAIVEETRRQSKEIFATKSSP